MKPLILISFVLFYCINHAQNLVYSGKIGSYSVELTFQSCDSTSGKIIGKYHYAKKKTYLNLSGVYYDEVMELTETVGNDTTGTWYLREEKDSLIGYWIGKDSHFQVKLAYKTGNKRLLKKQTLEEKSTFTSNQLNGHYEVAFYFLNDMWYDDDNPSVEIGYNGGYVDILSISKDSLTFIAEMVCGPTYHIAFAEGTAYKIGTNYVYKYEDECEITISFSEKKLKIVANKSFECGFGARAYMDHELYKIND